MSEPMTLNEVKQLGVVAEVIVELRQAMLNHKPINSLHEGYGVILEELDEFWEEVRKQEKDRQSYRQRKEMIQVAAMAIRIILDVIK